MVRATHTLAEWQRGEGFNDTEAGAEFGVTRMTWLRWKAGTMVPGPGAMIELYRQSQGRIQPNDFYDLPVLTPKLVAA